MNPLWLMLICPALVALSLAALYWLPVPSSKVTITEIDGAVFDDVDDLLDKIRAIHAVLVPSCPIPGCKCIHAIA